MNKKLLRLGLAAGILAAGFAIGTIDTNEKQDISVVNDSSERIPEVEKPEEVQWGILEAQVTGKAIRGNSNGIIYEAILDVPSMASSLRLPLSSIEYRVLNSGDVVDLMQITRGDDTEYLQWWRDDIGKLNIHLNGPIAVIDAGHGGIDSGQGGNDLWTEKTMNLDMTKRMALQLQEAGIHVILTRTKDEYISLYDRVAIANYVNADILISNHVNRMDEETSGVEVLYSSHSDRDFANTLAEAVSTEEHPVFRVYRRRSYDIPGLDYYFLHKYTEVPSYIIEYGFADHEADRMYVYEHWEEMVDRASEVIVEALLE